MTLRDADFQYRSPLNSMGAGVASVYGQGFPRHRREHWLPGEFMNDWANLPDFVTSQQVDMLDLKREINVLNTKVSQLQRLIREQQKLLLAFSQSYYWTTEWQEREHRAETQLREGEGTAYETAEDLIKHLRSLP